MDTKLEKEAFVSGLEGTTIGEIYLLTVTLLAGYLLRCCSLVCIPCLHTRATSSVVIGFLLEYATIILPAILIFTVLADYAAYVLLAEIVVCGVLIANSLKDATKLSISAKQTLMSEYPLRHPYLTVTRTFVNLFTAVAILAVDFRVYPRRLAKAETYGFGLMDIGVGLFLMAHGLTSPEAREITRTVGRRRSVGLLRVTVGHVLPLLVLGCIRLITVKSTGYQEHVTEYGVHWNFFFTIAAVRILCSLLNPLLVSLPYGHGVAAVVIAFSHQVLLQWGGVESYVLLGPHGDGSRVGLLAANREGIVSCAGYLAIYAGWIQVGKWLFKPRKVLKDYFVLLLSLVPIFLSLWLSTVLFNEHVHSVSRRLVNLTYILWIFSCGFLILSTTVAIDLTVLVLTGTAHKLRPPPYTPLESTDSPLLCAASAVDYNQLAFFLLANICTGLVNFCVDTLHASTAWALVILALYMAVMLGTFITLHYHRVKIKPQDIIDIIAKYYKT